RQRPRQPGGRDVSPEHALLIQRLLFEQPAADTVRRGNPVAYPRRGFVADLEARAVEAKGEIDILEVSAKRLRQPSGGQQRIAAVEGAGAAGPEYAGSVPKC